MIIEKNVARKSLAVTLAFALFATTPATLFAQTQSASVVGGGAVGSLGSVGTLGAVTPNAVTIMAPVALGNLSLTTPSLVPTIAPTLMAPTKLSPVTNFSPASVTPAAVIAPAALERHPIVGILNALQAKGVALPETLSTREDAAKLVAAAQAMPEGSAKNDMMAMANAIVAANKAGGGVTPEVGKIFDAAQARAGLGETAPVKSGLGAWISKHVPLLARVTGGEKKETPAQPVNPEDFAVKIAEMHYAPGQTQLPESTAQVPVSDQQIVGQDGALKAIKFGLQMPGRHYNLFVAGPEGSGRETALRHVVEDVASKMKTPNDLVAATNFDDKDKPVVLELEPGRGPVFAKAVKKFVAGLKQVLPEALNSGEIGAAKKEIVASVQAAQQEREDAFNAEVAKIQLSGGFGVEFFAKPSGDGRMMIGLKITRGGKAIDPEKLDETIASGAFTREAFDKASKERDAKFPAVMEQFKGMMETGQKEMAAAQEKIGELEQSAVVEVVNAVGQGLAKIVLPETKVSPEMQELQKAHETWSEGFEQRLGAVSVEGKFGVTLAQTQRGIVPVMTFEGAPVTSQEQLDAIKAAGYDEARLQAVQQQINAQVGPLMKEFAAKSKEFMGAMQALAKKQPKAQPTAEQLAAARYVKSLMQFSADNYQIFLGRGASAPDEDGAGGVQEAPGQKPVDAQDFFEVNALTNNGALKGAPVVWVKNPTFDNIFGVADDNRRTMIIPGVGLVKGGAPGGPTLKGGAIQKANGGFLIINVMDALREPGVWQGLMSAIRSGEAEIADDGLRGMMMGKGSTYHIPSKVKVVLIGSPSLRMMIAQHDQDFGLNFQSNADFESTLKVSEDSVSGYVQFFKKAVTQLSIELKQGALDLTRDAMSALIEHGARLADSNQKLTAQFGAMYGVIREATYWAQQAGRTEVRREDVDTALQSKQDREETYRRHLIEVYKQNIFVVETSGKKVGQINGLAVMGSFGVPMRITVVPSAAEGAGGIISVDRNAGPEQTGSSFNKALGVVEGFLQNLFAQKRAFPARLSISYEQNYGGIDGDSATSTEMYAILSALSGVAIGQNFAVTGSADQFGNVQAIGGVNHKIEGFYELCKSRGLTGQQGIVIPRSNVADLQLSPEVVQAVKDGKFHIYAVDHISQGLEILTGTSYQEILSKASAHLAEMGKGGAK